MWNKTKLLVFTTKQTEAQARVELAVTTISVDGHTITPTFQAEGNGPHISERLSAHRRAVYGVIHSGLAKGYRANPAASLRVETIFAA